MTLPAQRIESFSTTAVEAARAAARIHLRHLGRIRIEDAVDKGTCDFVSEVDLEAQEAALEVIRRSFPDHEVLAEEDDGTPSPDPDRDPAVPLWIVDPLDGTTNYLHGHPAFCASVGVVVAGEAVAGAVLAPALRACYRGWSGGGAWIDDLGPRLELRAGTPARRIRTSQVATLRQALVGTGFPFKRPDEIPGYLDELGRMLRRSSGVRREGAAALDLCRLAEGSLDAFWEGPLAPWDVAAGLVILREAGGVHSAPGGAPYDVVRGGALRAANGNGLLEALHGALQEPVDPG